MQTPSRADLRLYADVLRDGGADRRGFFAHELERFVGMPLGVWVANHAPRWLRRWVVVQVCNDAVAEEIRAGRRPDQYAGPDGIGYREMYHAAEREPVPS